MKLGVHYHIPAMVKNGNIYMPAHFGRFVDGLAKHCEKLVCFLHSPRNNELGLMDYSVKQPNVSLIDIGPHESVLKRTLFSRRYTNPIKKHRSSLDVMLIRGPSPLLPDVARAVHPLPVVLLIVGDYLAGVDDLPQPRWRKEAIRLWSYSNSRRQKHTAQKSLTFVNSHKLFEEMNHNVPHLIETRTTTLISGDFFNREDTCLKRPYHILYTGRLDRGKGLLVLGEAIAILVSMGQDIHLDLVGWPEQRDPVLEELQELAIRNNFADRLHYMGYKTVGDELFACYRAADIFVNASLASEGFPRTIWEAMANSLPVIATRVGSIPDFIEGAAELIPPRNVQALVRAILFVLDSPTRRRELISKGMQLAQQNTLEIQSGKMIAEIRLWLNTV